MMRRSLVLAAAPALALLAAVQAASPPAAGLPPWWQAHVTFMTADGGAWLTPNAAISDDPAAADAFGMEWRAVNEGFGLVGRLYGVRNGCETAEFWSFREFWHPGEKRVLLQQWGGPGVYGAGVTTSPAPDESETDQTFWLPDGRSWREGHRASEEGDVYVTESYDIDAEGKWMLSTRNRWRRLEADEIVAKCPSPDRGDSDATPAGRADASHGIRSRRVKSSASVLSRRRRPSISPLSPSKTARKAGRRATGRVKAARFSFSPYSQGNARIHSDAAPGFPVV